MCANRISKDFLLSSFKISQYLAARSITEKVLDNLQESKCQLHQLDQCPMLSEKLNKDEALTFFDQMSLIRRMETTANRLYQNGFITGFCHLYSGQEACAVGIKSVMRSMDTAVTSYRCHAWALLMSGATEEALRNVFRELTGRRSGLSGGKGGSMHLFTDNFYGGYGVVGAYVSLGTGLAFAHKYKNDGGICFTMMGDGATNSGQVYESFNHAKLYNLPVIYVIENNNYGMGTAIKRCSSNTDLFRRGDQIPGIRISGLDVSLVRDATKFAVKYVTDGKGPMIIELITYRYSGHSVADSGRAYRTRTEVKQIMKKYDPIENLRLKILRNNLATEEDLKAIEMKNAATLKRATEAAKKDPEPPLTDLIRNVYTEYEETPRTISRFKQ